MSLELIERLEKATGPDRELDARLYVVICEGREWREDGHVIYSQKSPKDVWRVGYIDPGRHSRNFSFSELSIATMVPTYTASIDAALALVERMLPGAWWIMARGRVRQGDAAQLFRENHNPFTSVPLAEAEHEDMPLAILIALLRALTPNGANK